jgi:hypothetical protein
MKKNINLLKWNKKFKGVNITINDNKRLIKLFEGKYQQFLFRHKGTEINSKEDIINLLNRKPRSFLTTLNILVKTFKNYDHRLTAHISKLHPKQITNLTKKTSNITNSGIEITKLSNSKLSIPKKNFEILTEKITKLTKSLQNNKLAIPLNLFNPLLKINSSHVSLTIKGGTSLAKKIKEEEQNTKFSLKQTPLRNVKMPETDLLDKYGRKIDLQKIEHEKYNALYDFKTKVTKYKNIIKKYNTNNIVPLTYIKYFKLITSFKFKDSFQENINFKFNLGLGTNKKKIKNIFTLLEYAFRGMSCLISKPVYMETPEKLIINLFYFLVPSLSSKGREGKVKKVKSIKRATVPIATSLNGISIPGPFVAGANTFNNKKSSISSLRTQPLSKGGKVINKNNCKVTRSKILFSPKNIQKLNNLCTILSRLFKKSIELDLVRLHLPYFDDNILVKAIGIMSKKIHVRNIIKYIFSKTVIHSKRVNNLTNKGSIIPSFLSGIKIKIGGRLMTQRVIPRLSTRVIQRGAIATGKVNYVDWSRVNLKNKRGAYSITVTMSHVL